MRSILGISFLVIGIVQLFTAKKMYSNIKKNVKDPMSYMFVGVVFSVILGGAFIIGGFSMLF